MRTLCIASLSGVVARLGHPKLKWHAGVFMWWEWIDLHDHGLEISWWSVLPVTLCIGALVASQTGRNRLASWTTLLVGVVLAMLFVHARMSAA